MSTDRTFPNRSIKNLYAVECEHGIIPVLAKGHRGIKTWSLAWYVIYDSDGRVVDEHGSASITADRRCRQ